MTKQVKLPQVTKARLQKAMTLPPAKLGDSFEQDLKDHFKYLASTRKLYYHRMPDTKMAGNFLPDSPADFLVRTPRGAYLVEAKASARHNSLRSCLSANVSPGQALHHKLWDRAGGQSYFIFCGVSVPTVQLWDGEYVAHCRGKGHVLSPKMWLLDEQDPTDGGLLQLLENLF